MARPIQVRIEDIENESGLSYGQGWETINAERFFREPPPTNQNPSQASKRKTMTVKESEEATLIYKSVSEVQLFIDDASGRHYKMKCDLDPLIAKNPELLRRQKAFCKSQIFVCQIIMIKMLDYKFVKNLKLGEWKQLPVAYKKALKSYVENAEKECIQKLTTWQTTFRNYDAEGVGYVPRREYVYQATISAADGKRHRETFIVDGSWVKDVHHEPWIRHAMTTLSSVHSHRTVTMGEGSKVKDGNKKERPVPGDTQRATIPNWTNFWFSEDNSMKLSVEGALANWLFHLGATEEANAFKHLATLVTQNLKDVMKVEKLPKKVQCKNGSLNPIPKCLWILREKFNCKTTAHRKTSYLSKCICLSIMPSVRHK